jgi:2-hydroxyacyl-CoA lyase 1
MAELDAPTLIAKCLKQQGIRFIFGIVGIPVTRTACEAQNYGIQFVGMRNEQAASFAAGAIGYLTQYPAVCLTVAGPGPKTRCILINSPFHSFIYMLFPGMVNAIPGLLNAKANCWPMILLSASSEAEQQGMGAFQESVQLEAARPYTKFCARIEKLLYFPNLLVQAIRHATYGRPGPVYLEVTANVFTETVSEKQITFPVCCPPPPQAAAPAQAIRDAIALLKNATRPLVIIGKGAAYACAEIELRRFIETTRFPFLPSPMGKGVIPDDHTFCVSAARSSALKDAETILLVGARLNWMFHFGQPPK